MAFYIKVSVEVAEQIGAPVENRNLTADGNILLWQADLNVVPGDTIFDRAAYVGGVPLIAVDAKAEIDGLANPAVVTVPDRFKDSVSEESVVNQDLTL